MFSFLSSWVHLSLFFPWTLNFALLHHLAHCKCLCRIWWKDFIVRILLFLEFPPLKIRHSICLHLYVDVSDLLQRCFSRTYSLQVQDLVLPTELILLLSSQLPFIIHNTIDFLIDQAWTVFFSPFRDCTQKDLLYLQWYRAQRTLSPPDAFVQNSQWLELYKRAFKCRKAAFYLVPLLIILPVTFYLLINNTSSHKLLVIRLCGLSIYMVHSLKSSLCLYFPHN